ncbi:MAG: putative membrane protein YhhN [Saprospiraceae bacterium]|jgi:uncharacterized membrane protein YhhN
MLKKTNLLLLFFFLLCLINIWAEYNFDKTFIYCTKPLLMTTLAIWFWTKTGLKNIFSKLIFGALIFSIGGDTLLMFVESGGGEHFFILGLLSFLIAHCFYFFAFYKYQSKARGWLRRSPWAGLPLLLYFGFFNGYLMPNVPAEMKIPVIVYSLAITAMALACLNLFGKLNNTLFQLIFIGVMLFVLSDSIIAINKFQSDQLNIPYARLWIMTLYLTGQFLITKGAAQATNQLSPNF